MTESNIQYFDLNGNSFDPYLSHMHDVILEVDLEELKDTSFMNLKMKSKNEYTSYFLFKIPVEWLFDSEQALYRLVEIAQLQYNFQIDRNSEEIYFNLGDNGDGNYHHKIPLKQLNTALNIILKDPYWQTAIIMGC